MRRSKDFKSHRIMPTATAEAAWCILVQASTLLNVRIRSVRAVSPVHRCSHRCGPPRCWKAGRLLGTGGAGCQPGLDSPERRNQSSWSAFLSVVPAGSVCLTCTILPRMSGYRAVVPGIPEAEAEGVRV